MTEPGLRCGESSSHRAGAGGASWAALAREGIWGQGVGSDGGDMVSSRFAVLLPAREPCRTPHPFDVTAPWPRPPLSLPDLAYFRRLQHHPSFHRALECEYRCSRPRLRPGGCCASSLLWGTPAPPPRQEETAETPLVWELHALLLASPQARCLVLLLSTCWRAY